MLKKVRALIASQLMQGVSVKGLARTLVAAVVCGTFPLIGFTTGLSFFVGIIFKLNQPVLHLVNQLLGIVQVLLIPIYISIGEWLVGAPPISLNINTMISEFSGDFILFLKNYGMAGLHAIFARALLSIPTGFLVYFISKYFLSKSNLERTTL